MTRICLFVGLVLALVGSASAFASPAGTPVPEYRTDASGIPAASYFFPESNTTVRLDKVEAPVPEMAAAPAYKAPETGATVYGLVKQGSNYNIVSANVEAQSALTVKAVMETGGLTYTAAVYVNGQYHVISEFSGLFFPVKIYDVTSWDLVSSSSYNSALYTVSMTYNRADGKVYGCFTNAGASAYDFATLDIATGTKSVIAALPQRFVAVSADAAGDIFGIAADGKLYKIAADGALTEVGATGVTPDTSLQDACFDEDNGQLYWATGNSIYVVDTATGHAEKVTEIEGDVTEWIGLFSRSAAAGSSPTWVDDLTVTFDRDALTGKISFKMPAKDTAGAPLSGTLKYYIMEDGEIASGEAEAGALVSETVTVAEGNHEFTVYASNNGTDGISSLYRLYVGHDTPKAPANVNVADGGIDNIVITWDAVTTGVNSGYVNLDGLRYTVVRQPGNVVVAEGEASTTVTDATVPSMGYYTYEVSASDGVKTGAVTRSSRVLLGSDVGIMPPYKYTFDEEGGFGLFTEKDVNGDGYKWAYSTNPAMVWYIVNPSADSDDWLIAPPINVETGKNYNLQIDLVGSSRYETERIEILYGTSPEPEDMNKVIMAPADFRVYNDIDLWFVPEMSGKIYVGLHVVTPAVEGAIRIDRFEMSAGFASESPDTVTGAKVDPAPMGGMSAKISFKCPEKTFNGNALQQITKVIVKNNTTGKVMELTDAVPGKEMIVTDDAPVAGQNDYSVACHNEHGAGMNVDLSVWVGVDVPGLPRNVMWRQTGDNTVTLSWDAPEGGEHGGYVDIPSLKYHVVIPEPFQVIVSDYDKTEISLQLQLPQSQDVLSFGVAGVNEAGIGLARRSNQSAYGAPLETPFYESFEGANLHSSPWLVKQVSGNSSCYVLNYIQGVPLPYDDNGMVAFTTTSVGATRLELPMLDISRLTAPALKLWICFVGDLGKITVRGNNNSGTEWVDIKSVPAKMGWHLVTVPLDKFKGEKRVQLGIEMTVDEVPTISNLSYVLVDKISVDNNPDYDLMISDISVPDQAQAGATFATVVQVTNAGAKAVENYTVDVTVNGDPVVSKPCGRIEPDEMVPVEIEVPLSPNATSLDMLASVVCQGDTEIDNNDRGVSGVKVIRSRYPQPSHLSNVSDNANRVELTWTAPATRYKASVMDDMEAYTNGDIGGIDVKRKDDNSGVIVTQNVGAIGPFKLIDNDKLPTAFVQLAWGRLPNLGNGMVCQVIDVETTGFTSISTVWAGHSGNKVLCFWKSLGLGEVDDFNVPNDDYLILPKLAEEDPHISLWAKSITDRYGLETFDVMVSMDGNNVEDFVVYQSVTNVPAGYASAADAGFTFYEFDLPEGTQYAAIRYNAVGTMALLVDDITYTPDDNYQDVTLLGYNVYRNNMKINNELVTKPEFTDVPDKDGNYIYNVTAVFAEGESRFSNSVRVNGFTSGIDDVNADAMQSILVDGRDIVIAGYAGEQVSVYTPDGRIVATVAADEETRVRMTAGIYIVKVGNRAESVAVR